jgi:hypothetical protein
VKRCVLLAIVALTIAAPTARPSAAGTWYWSAGLCKSSLRQYGMRLDDGRTFRIAQSYCVGKGGAGCEWNASHTRRLYDHFVVFARSPDGGVRGFDLYPTGQSSYRALHIELLDRHTAAEFDRLFASIAASAARLELEKGCAPYQG